MAKLSLVADDDGDESPGGRVPKRQRVQPGSSVEVQFEERRLEASLLDEEEEEEEEGEDRDPQEEDEDDDGYEREYECEAVRPARIRRNNLSFLDVLQREYVDDDDEEEEGEDFYVPEDEAVPAMRSDSLYYDGEREEEEEYVDEEEDNGDDVYNREDDAVYERELDEDEAVDPESVVSRIRELGPEPMEEDVCSDGSIYATLTDPDVLDCPICYEPLTVPVFQCDNGHVACNSCCLKMENSCGSCSSPIGHNRCRAMEKVLESVKISCQYRKYGCTESFAYGMKLTHDKTCAHSPCACPLQDCTFLGSSTQLADHFTSKHNHSAIPFRFTRPEFITIGVDEKYVILREERDGSLFSVENRTKIMGNMITVSRIGTSTMEQAIHYEVVAKSLECSLRMESIAKTVSKTITTPSEFLLVPAGFFGPCCRQMKLDICIGL